MSQKSSVPQAAKFVSQALKRDTMYMRKYNARAGPIRENFAREISIWGGCRPCTVPEDDLLLGLRAWRVSDTRRAGPPLHALRVCGRWLFDKLPIVLPLAEHATHRQGARPEYDEVACLCA